MKSIFKTRDYATERMRDAASSARVSLLDLGTQVLRLVNNVRESERRGVRGMRGLLGRVGLHRRSSPLKPVLWIAAGAAIGGAGIFFAPAIGRGLRAGTSRIRSALHGPRSTEVPAKTSPSANSVRSGGYESAT